MERLRRRIERLSSPGGRFYVACARTGVQPPHVEGKRFETRADAERAGDLATAYRATVRNLRPELPVYDLVATQAAVQPDGTSLPHPSRADLALIGSSTPPQYPQTAYVRAVLEAMFAALAARRADGIKRAVREAYRAEGSVRFPSAARCLELLETLAAVCDTAGFGDQVEALLGGVVEFLPPSAGASSVGSAAAWLESIGFLESYRLRTATVDGSAACRLTICGDTDGPVSPELATLLLRVELRRRLLAGLQTAGARDVTGRRWRCRFVVASPAAGADGDPTLDE